ncbi:hypothetical protein Tco_0499421 [Tanacetum coccineum]
MDWHTKNTLWAYWKRGDHEEVISDDEVPKDGSLTNEDEIAQIFRIDTDLFHFETLLCQTFKKLNCPYHMDGDKLTKDTHELTTNEECKDDWIYERNNRILWVEEKPRTSNEEWAEPMNDIHLPRLIREGNSIRYESYEWRSEDEIVQDEIELNNDEGDDMGHLDDHLVHKNEPFNINMEEEGFNERKCKPLGIPFTRSPWYRTERFELADTAYPTPMDMAY